MMQNQPFNLLVSVSPIRLNFLIPIGKKPSPAGVDGVGNALYEIVNSMHDMLT